MEHGILCLTVTTQASLEPDAPRKYCGARTLTAHPHNTNFPSARCPKEILWSTDSDCSSSQHKLYKLVPDQSPTRQGEPKGTDGCNSQFLLQSLTPNKLYSLNNRPRNARHRTENLTSTRLAPFTEMVGSFNQTVKVMIFYKMTASLTVY